MTQQNQEHIIKAKVVLDNIEQTSGGVSTDWDVVRHRVLLHCAISITQSIAAIAKAVVYNTNRSQR